MVKYAVSLVTELQSTHELLLLLIERFIVTTSVTSERDDRLKVNIQNLLMLLAFAGLFYTLVNCIAEQWVIVEYYYSVSRFIKCWLYKPS